MCLCLHLVFVHTAYGRCALGICVWEGGPWCYACLQDYKDHVETYYQLSLLLFKESGLTAYKLKLDIIWRLLESGYLKDPWNHLTESGEKSHHTSSKEYHSKTTRDGGLDERNKNSEYLDLLFTFWRTTRLCLMRDIHGASTFMGQMQNYADKFDIKNERRQYLEIVQKPVVEPGLNEGKTEFTRLFCGMRFQFLGTFKNHTQTDLAKLVKACGGIAITDNAAIAMSTRYQRVAINKWYCNIFQYIYWKTI